MRAVRFLSEQSPRALIDLRWTTDTLSQGHTPVSLIALDGQTGRTLYAVGTTADSEVIVFAFDGTCWHLVATLGARGLVLHRTLFQWEAYSLGRPFFL